MEGGSATLLKVTNEMGERHNMSLRVQYKYIHRSNDCRQKLRGWNTDRRKSWNSRSLAGRVGGWVGGAVHIFRRKRMWSKTLNRGEKRLSSEHISGEGRDNDSSRRGGLSRDCSRGLTHNKQTINTSGSL